MGIYYPFWICREFPNLEIKVKHPLKLNTKAPNASDYNVAIFLERAFNLQKYYQPKYLRMNIGLFYSYIRICFK